MSGDMSSDMSAARRFASHSDASGVRSSRTMTELLNSFKESNKDRSSSPVSASPVSSLSASSPTSAAVTTLGVDICSSASHFFEVLYIGKIKVSHKRVPDTFIDDALEKFQSHELEKNRSRLVKSTSDFGSRQIPQMPSLLQTIGSSEHVSISPSSSVNSVDTDNATGSFSGSVESLPYRESQQFLSTGDTFRTIAFSYRLGETSVRKIINEVYKAMWSFMQPVFMPEPDRDMWEKLKKNSEPGGIFPIVLDLWMVNMF